MKKIDLTLILGIVTLIGACFGAYFFIDTRYAQCEDVRRIERRLDYKIENDQLMGMRQRSWQLSDPYPQQNQAPPEIRQQIRELESNIRMQENKVKRLEER